jgi:two-component system, NarL family, response regulator
MKNTRPHTLLIVDDHPVFRSGLAAILNAQPDLHVLAQGGSAEEAMALYRKHRPALTILDLRLPDRSGVDVILALKKEDPQSRFLILTTFDADEDIYRAVQAGAMNYLLKGMKAEELVKAVGDALRGESTLPASISARLAQHVSQPALTPREAEVLQGLAAGRSNKEIALDLGISDETIKWHMRSVFQKLGVADRTQAVITAVQRGLCKLLPSCGIYFLSDFIGVVGFVFKGALPVFNGFVLGA